MMKFDKSNFKIIQNKDVNINTYIEGSGPLIIFIHGWPESWYSWRHQIKFFSSIGYTVASPDMRGYGGSSKPEEVSDYDVLKLSSDIIAIADYLGFDQFNIVGHDWGAPVAWHTSLYYENRVKKVCGMSVPHTVSQMPPIETMKFLFKDIFFYMLYFQKVGLVEKELELDMKKSLLAIYGSISSGENKIETFEPVPFSKDMTFLKSLGEGHAFPYFMSQNDFDFYVTEFSSHGMRGPINWYRNIDRNWEITKDTHAKKISTPTCFITGANDPVGKWAPINKSLYENLEGNHSINDCGHWVQQEKPDQVNEILLEFFK